MPYRKKVIADKGCASLNEINIDNYIKKGRYAYAYLEAHITSCKINNKISLNGNGKLLFRLKIGPDEIEARKIYASIRLNDHEHTKKLLLSSRNV